MSDERTNLVLRLAALMGVLIVKIPRDPVKDEKGNKTGQLHKGVFARVMHSYLLSCSKELSEVKKPLDAEMTKKLASSGIEQYVVNPVTGIKIPNPKYLELRKQLEPIVYKPYYDVIADARKLAIANGAITTDRRKGREKIAKDGHKYMGSGSFRYMAPDEWVSSGGVDEEIVAQTLAEIEEAS